MGIDWLTVGGQAINFIFLVWLMKRFLYKPILTAIGEREKKVSAQISDASAQKAEAQKLREKFKSKNEDLDQRRAKLLEDAKENARAEQLRLFAEAKKESVELRIKWQETFQNEKKRLSKELGRLAQNEVFAIVRKVLDDLSGVELEKKIVEVFIKKLDILPSSEKTKLKESCVSVSTPLQVVSSFELSRTQKSVIESTVTKILNFEAIFSYETFSGKIAGIEISVNSQKIAWSIGDYLTSMEKSFVDQLKATEEIRLENGSPGTRAVEDSGEAQL